jgi:PhnB protein
MGYRTKGIPENSSVVMPRLYCRDVAAKIDFCKTVFGAVELNRRSGPDGKAHALLTIGPAMIMIETEWPRLASRAPGAGWQFTGCYLRLRRGCRRDSRRAVAGGAKILVAVQNQFYRIGWVVDPAGHVWTIATRVEETTEQQRKDRWSDVLAKLDK